MDIRNYTNIGGVDGTAVYARNRKYHMEWSIRVLAGDGSYFFDLFTSRNPAIRERSDYHIGRMINDLGEDKVFRVLLMIKLFAPHMWDEAALPRKLKTVYIEEGKKHGQV